MLAPDTFPTPEVITDTPNSCGLPLIVNGVLVEFAPDAAVEAKVAALHPLDAAWRWFGFESTELIPSGAAGMGECSSSAANCTADDNCPANETCDDLNPEKTGIKMIY